MTYVLFASRNSKDGLTVGRRGPAAKLSLFATFNYILRLLYLGCQWKELPIEQNSEGVPEIHYTRIYSTFRRWVDDAIFTGSVLTLHQHKLLDTTVIHGDGTTTAAKKGGDNIGFSGHKKVKGDKVVAFCDRNCNVIAPFVSAPGNRNESPLLREALPELTRTAIAIGLDLQGSIVSLDGVYDCKKNRKVSGSIRPEQYLSSTFPGCSMMIAIGDVTPSIGAN